MKSGTQESKIRGDNGFNDSSAADTSHEEGPEGAAVILPVWLTVVIQDSI